MTRNLDQTMHAAMTFWSARVKADASAAPVMPKARHE